MEHEIFIIMLCVLIPFAAMKIAELTWEIIDWIRARKSLDQ